jgi:predicted PurR-regulated permease PerM
MRELPEIGDKSIPLIIQWGQRYQIELPFTDYDSLKDLAFGTVKSEVTYLGRFANFAKGATMQFIFLAIGCTVAISLFLDPRVQLDRPQPANTYTVYTQAIAERFKIFYESFATVMGAQVLISAVNTLFTGIFALVMHLPYSVVVIGITFLCGLLPVIGNLVSNSIIVCIGFTVSPKVALIALIFLVVIHKMEYLLNSQIIGHRIQNPLWLTLLALVLGERLMGIPGIILAPVVLNYIKLEASRHAE